jgi:transposase
LYRVFGLDPNRFVFFDECGAKTNMTRLYGRVVGGGRLVDSAPHGHWRTTTLMSSMRLDGAHTAMCIDGATDRTAFETYVDKVLLPTLRTGDILVMDNLQAHKSPRAITRIEAKGAELWFLPPYSPDMNPIEMMFSKIKTLLRKAKARTVATLDSAIAESLQAVTTADIQGWFQKCGYR